jgi:glycosyltransferase involved in cell wall biosynthesis
MNICIITSSFPSHPDDLVQAPFLIPFLRGLQKRGHRVFVFTQDRKGRKEAFLERIQVRWFPWMGSDKPLVHLNPFRPLDTLRIGSLFLEGRKELLPFIRENRVDACLALWVLPSGAFAYHAYRRDGIPYSVWALGSDIYRYGRNPLLHWMMKRIIQKATGVFADGFDLSKKVEERFERKCFFLATTRPLMDDGEGRVSPPRPSNRFLFVGRLEKVKGIDLLLQAMALLNGEKADVHLTVIGGGGMEEWARSFVSEKGLEENVSLTGNVSDEALALHYRSCDCVVIPSRSESIPLVFSEALQFNKDLIVTDVGDMGMLGRQYGVAWVVPPEDPSALKEMMKRRFESGGQEKDREGDGKRAELKHLFNIETSVERFLADYT